MGKSKLTEEQKKEIIELYKTGKYSYRALGRIYNIVYHSIVLLINPERKAVIKEYDRKRHAKNKEREAIRSKEYYKENRERILARGREYKKNNYEKIIKKAREYARSKVSVIAFVQDGKIDQIENYQLALKNDFKGWLTHHRLETHDSDGKIRLVGLTVQELKAMDMYYKRPPEELIFLKRDEHEKIHQMVKQRRK